jgi:glutaconate CoA-transferase subunit B
MNITDEERLVAAAARELVDGEVCFVGIGLPSLAALLAKHTHAPDLTLVYESGVIDAIPPSPPLSTGSPAVLDDTAMAGTCLDVFGSLQAGRLDVGLLSSAQIDRNGNLNTTVIGDYRKPTLRMVGSGGAHDISTLIGRCVIVMPHEPRRFVAAVDFITSPGYPTRGMPRSELAGGGPVAVITPRARFDFPDGEMTLTALQEGYTAAQAVEGFGWTPPVAPDLELIPEPAPDVLEILRTTVYG